MCCTFWGAERCTFKLVLIFKFYFPKGWSRHLWFQWEHHGRTLQTMDASGSILPIFQEPQRWICHGKLCFLFKTALCYITTLPSTSLLILTISLKTEPLWNYRWERLGLIRVNWEYSYLVAVLWILVVPTTKDHRGLCEPPGWALGAPWHEPGWILE